MEFVMSNSLNFPINYKYVYVTPGDYASGRVDNCKYMYAYAQNEVIKVLIDTSDIKNMNNMFLNCYALVILPFDTSNVTSMRNMFNGCSELTTIPQLDTSNVTDMSSMFFVCYSLTSIPQLDTSNVTDMSSMFGSCSKLTSIPLLDCQKVNSMSSMFGYSNINSITYLGGFKDLGKQSSVSGISSGFLDRAPNLTHESLMNVINNLYDRKANGLSNMSIKFGTKNLNKLTDEEKAIAVNKGWNLS